MRGGGLYMLLKVCLFSAVVVFSMIVFFKRAQDQSDLKMKKKFGII